MHTHDHGVFHYPGCVETNSDRCGCKNRTYRKVLLILGIVAVIEFWASDHSNSAALWADAWHVVTDMAAIVAVMFGTMLIRSDFDKRTVERRILVVQIALLCYIVYKILEEGLGRWETPEDFTSGTVMIVAVLGFLGNVYAHRIAHRAGSGKNNRAALLHILADALTNVAVFGSGILKWYVDTHHVPAPEWLEDWRLVDPIMLFVIVAVISSQILKLILEEIGWIKPSCHH